ncbi:hypothetical protein HUJ04_011455 [Dendroctonus ponderosae]|nr:hypothetical protein HUJ04_011455 [Dendroctonus ponderosae]
MGLTDGFAHISAIIASLVVQFCVIDQGKCYSNKAEAERTHANNGRGEWFQDSRRQAFQGHSEHCTTTDTFRGTKQMPRQGYNPTAYVK